MVYTDKKGVVFADGNKILIRCPKEFKGEYVIPDGVLKIDKFAFYRCRGLTSITIPDSVINIDECAFAWCAGLTSISIPNSVRRIGKSVFEGCTGLTSITIPSSITSIEDAVFSSCSGLISINLPNSITSIGERAFEGCRNLANVSIPNSVTSIGERAFEGCCNLANISIPGSVTKIGQYAFRDCKCLVTIRVDGNNPNYSSKDGVLFNRNQTTLIQYPIGQKGSYIIPNTVTKIEKSAFDGCSSLTSVTIGNNVTNIGDSAFRKCTGLTSITIPNSVTSIGSSAFNGVPNVICSLVAFGYPWGARSIKGYVEGCLVYSDNTKTKLLACSSVAIGQLIIPNSVTNIGKSAFEDCMSLTSIEIPNSVTNIGNSAFMRCSALTSITIPNSVTDLGEFAFYDCRSLTSITISNSITSIRKCAFSGCSRLASVEIPNSVTCIGQHAFALCSGLVSIAIPDRVLHIEEDAFVGCNMQIIDILTTYKKKLEESAKQKQREREAREEAEQRAKDVEAKRIAAEQERLRIIKAREAEEQRRMQEQQMQEMLQGSILFFDTETTGKPLNYKASVTDLYNWPRLVQLAWIMADKEGNVLKKKSVIIKPEGFSIPADSVAVHGITTERALREGLSLNDVLEEFATDLSLAEHIVGHNIDFDQHIVGAELCRLGMDFNALMDKPSTCTMKSSTEFCAIPNPNTYFGGYKWPSLQELYQKLFNRSFEDAHDALADVTATKECYFELKRRGII